MTQTLIGADIRGYYHALGIHLPDWAQTEASVRCFADPDSHRRGDHNPSCSVNLQHGAWNCHTCGAKGGAFDAATARGYTNHDAFDLMVRYGLAERRPDRHRPRAPRSASRPAHPGLTVARARQSAAPAPRLAITEPQVRRWHLQLLARPDLLMRLAVERGWSGAAVRELSLGLDGDRIQIPVRDGDGQLVSVLGYRPGGPAPKIRALRGSLRALYPHPAADPSRSLLLVEGEPDLIAARSRGLAAVAVPGIEGWQTNWAPLFTRREITVVMDADRQGRRCAQRLSRDLADHAEAVAVLDLGPDREDGYDLTDWLRERPGTPAELYNQLRSRACT